jgi:hypothetical protein
MGNKNDNIYSFLIEEMQANGGSDLNNQKSVERDPLILLKEVNKEEKALLNEKDELIRISQLLQQRINQEIEMRKKRMQSSQSEINSLKKECQTLQTLIKT